MGGLRILGLALVVVGVLALAHRGFTYTEDTHDVSLGPLKVSVEEKEHVAIPVWAGVLVTLGGGALLAFGGGSKR